MALEYFLYRTDFNNTVVDRSVNSFTPFDANEAEIQLDILIPNGQALYLYRYDGSTLVPNSESTVNEYLLATEDIFPTTPLETQIFTGYTATTNNQINAASNGGVLYGLELLQVNDTQYEITAGAAQLIDINFETGEVSKTIIEYSGGTFTPSGLTTNTITYVAIDRNSNIIEKYERFTSLEKENLNELGTVSHPNLQTIAFVFSRPEIPYDPVGQLVDLQDFIRIAKFEIDDFIITPSANTLSFSTTSGTLYRRGGNFINNKNNPDVFNIPEKSPQEFNYINQFGVIETGLTTTINPTQYEEVGTGNILPITGNTNQATILRVWIVESGRVFIQRGQSIYRSIGEATANLIEDRKKHVSAQSLIDTGLIIGEIISRVSAIELDNTRDSLILNTDKFGGEIGSAASDIYRFSNTEIITQKSSFPNPNENDDIILQDNITYLINGIINLGTSRLVLGNNTLIEGKNVATDNIIGNRADELIFSNDNNVVIGIIGFRNFNTTGKIFNLNGSGLRNSIIRQTIITDSIVGNFSDFNLIQFNNNLITNSYGGFEVSGNTSLKNKVIISNSLFETPLTEQTYISVRNSQYYAISIYDCSFEMSNSGITGIAFESGFTVNAGKISENEFVSTGSTVLGIPISGVTNETPRFTLNDNVGLSQGDVQASVFGFLNTNNNTLETTIANITNYVKANFINSVNSVAINFLLSQNRLTYNGDTDGIVFSFLLNGDLFTNSNNQTLRVAIFKNGTENLVEQEVRADTSTVAYAYGLNGITTLNIGDYLEVFVRNTTQARNIIVRTVQLQVSEI